MVCTFGIRCALALRHPHWFRTGVAVAIRAFLSRAQVVCCQARRKILGDFAYRRHSGFYHLDNAMARSEEHTSELQSLMRISYAVFCLKKKITNTTQNVN